ncbi:Structural maintenance of chromosomes protein 1, partial [Nowakowskiella sp. JEL0078]
MRDLVESLKRLFPGVRGRLMDLCKPTQRKFDLAVSIILGRNIDSIVVDSQQVALECIQYLRTQRIGQATFLPLDTIQTKPLAEKYRGFAKGARLAVDVLQFEAVYEKAILLACGNALVCDSMNVAKFICYEKKQEVKAVTLEGTVIHKAGLITGGVTKESGNRRWDDKDVDVIQLEMRKTREQLRSDLADLQKQERKSASEEALRSAVDTSRAKLRNISEDLEETERKEAEIVNELNHLDREITRIEREIEKETRTITTNTTAIDEIDQEIQVHELRIFRAFCQKIGVENIREYEQTEL